MDKNKQQTFNSGLYIVSTPIGNMDDITLRALNVLKKSDIILCEDTRRSGKLLSNFKISKKLISYHKFNEKKILNKIFEYLNNNKIVSLISDAGTPTISDPGMLLVNKCIDENINIYPIPGPTAIMISEVGNAPAKLIKDFRKKNDKPILKGAYVEETVFVGDDQLKTLVDIKSKNELIGEVIGLLQSPAKNVLSALTSSKSTIAGIVKTLSEKES